MISRRGFLKRLAGGAAAVAAAPFLPEIELPAPEEVILEPIYPSVRGFVEPNLEKTIRAYGHGLISRGDIVYFKDGEYHPMIGGQPVHGAEALGIALDERTILVQGSFRVIGR